MDGSCQRGGFCNGMGLVRGGSDTDVATPSYLAVLSNPSSTFDSSYVTSKNK